MNWKQIEKEFDKKFQPNNKETGDLFKEFKFFYREKLNETHWKAYEQGRLKCLEQHNYVYKPEVKKMLERALKKGHGGGNWKRIIIQVKEDL